MRHLVATAAATVLLTSICCGQGLPEVRPGWFDTPVSEVAHGRLVEKSYTRGNGPHGLISYKVIELDGRPIPFEGGYIWKTSWCEVDGIEAVAFVARGPKEVAGRWVLQVHEDQPVFERVCAYSADDPARWRGARWKACAKWVWDAERRARLEYRKF